MNEAETCRTMVRPKLETVGWLANGERFYREQVGVSLPTRIHHHDGDAVRREGIRGIEFQPIRAAAAQLGAGEG